MRVSRGSTSSRTIDRRQASWFVVAAGGTLLSACLRKRVEPSPPAAADAAPTAPSLQTWSFDADGTHTEVTILAPDSTSAKRRLPMLLALHGRGEAVKGPHEGALGWPRDYALARALERVIAPPLNQADFEGLVDVQRLASINAALASRPFGGLVVVCPYVPNLNLDRTREVLEYGRFLVDVVVPRARRELPVLASPEATGLDGVSLGGAAALRVGLGNPRLFGAIGALQPAIGAGEVPGWTETVRAARQATPALPLRLTTSHGDYFREAVNALHASLLSAGLAHEFAEIEGPHDYPFNRGPGAYEMILWHDRVLARA